MPSSVLIVSPYAASANNGNWRTAARWAQLLRPRYEVIVRTTGDPLPTAEILVALHARRSHAVVRSWCGRADRGRCIVVLTATDLYRDIPNRDAAALDSLRLADRLVVLQERGIRALPARFRPKAAVVYQSADALLPVRKSSRVLRALFVGHIRAEKDPLCFAQAASRLAARPDIELALVGGARDPALARVVERLVARTSNASMLGALSHGVTRQRIRRAHVLVVPSRMEGGANVIVEAAVSGTPVLASDCDGNVGMLGEKYAGYFEGGDAAALARLLVRCRDEPAFLQRLTRMCAARALLFSPAHERRALNAVLSEL